MGFRGEQTKSNPLQTPFLNCNFYETVFQSMRSEIFTSVLENLVTFVKTSHDNPVTEIPTATLLTGINMPDHSAQFSALKVAIKKNVTPHIAMLKSDSCLNLKRLIENFVYQIVNNIDKDSDDVRRIFDSCGIKSNCLKCRNVVGRRASS